MAVHAESSIQLNTIPAYTSLLGGHFVYRANGTQSTPASANVVESSINLSNPAQWGYNTHIGASGIKLRYNEIDLSAWTNNSLSFYNPSTHEADAILTSNGLVLSKGGIVVGTTGSNNSIYISTDNLGSSVESLVPTPSGGISKTDWRAVIGSKFGVDSEGNLYANNADISGRIIATEGQIGGWNIGTDTNKSLFYGNQVPGAASNNLVISSNSAENTIPIAGSDINKHWFLSAGTKFGVDSDGNLYANNAHLSEAHVDGDIVAQSLTIGSGGGAYDGAAAINISGYTIEITIDSTGVMDIETTTYLYPHLYHNGIEVTTGIDYSHFIWYRNDDSIGTEGDADNQGRYLATYGDSYRVIYDFDDGAVGGGTEVQTRTVDPSKYITRINDTGITIHPEVWNNESSYIQLDGTGMELFDSNKVSIAQYGTTTRIGFVNGKNIYLDNNGMQIRSGSTSLASFGTTAQIGQNGNSRFLMNTDSLQAYNSNNQKYFEVNENGLSWGNNTAATTSQVDMAAQTATNFISYDSTNGLQLASSLPLTATRKLQILNDAIKVQNDNSNYLNINSDGMQIWANSKKIADFGSDVILGDSNEAHSIFKSSALEFYTNTTNKIVSINNDGTFKVYDNDFPVMTVGSFNGFQGILLDCINLNKTGGHLFGIGSSKSSDTENFASHVTLSSYAEPSSTDTGYSDAYLQLEAMSNKGLNYHYISISAVKDGWSGIESSVAITVNSDERLKENCIPVNNISNLLFEIKPIVYSWKDKRTEQRYFGFKAQEVKAALERVVENVEEYAIVGKNRDGYYNLSYMELIPLIVDIIQKMNERIIELENKMEE